MGIKNPHVASINSYNKASFNTFPAEIIVIMLLLPPT